MNLIYEIIIVGLVLSADSFSAALAMGTRPYTKRDSLKFAFSSGGAEAFFTLLGALAGSVVISRFSAIDHWIAFILIGAVALHMAYEGVMGLLNKHEEEKEAPVDFHSFKKVLLVSFATSIDAFSVGIGLGVAGKPIIPFVASIGFWAFTTTIIGLYLGKKLSEKLGFYMNLIGALVLTYLAFEALKI